MYFRVEDDTTVLFELNDRLLARIVYEPNYVDKATVEINGAQLALSSDRKMPPSYEFFKDKRNIGDARFNFLRLFGKSYITVRNATGTSAYKMKRRGIMNDGKRFIVTGSNGTNLTLTLIDSKVGLLYDYEVEIASCSLAEEELHELLIFCYYTATISMHSMPGYV